ncbi:DNA replication pre-initiation complex subunit Sld3 [Schizosaccharomyces japonicus yFS275]|uniref:DNA replication pre-initiation complex subunit Sld3 n=1 Tax=Schizosaccharomyces japonicus (strain yFS275 / FY16936) TaxID=402676 RepID=B6K6K6_SCHJY|nr:DNA replication pre-initiation complex subunit Sld3 [Schizosaccharomyces japonicus yFS275]EEB09160.1 DNA replication pre-initiation complex subunit Sld3 [Schizosaccharomyces japonicus yFS275]
MEDYSGSSGTFCIKAPAGWKQSVIKVTPLATTSRQNICLHWCLPKPYHTFTCTSLQFIVLRPAGSNILLGEIQNDERTSLVAIEHVREGRICTCILVKQCSLEAAETHFPITNKRHGKAHPPLTGVTALPLWNESYIALIEKVELTPKPASTDNKPNTTESQAEPRSPPSPTTTVGSIEHGFAILVTKFCEQLFLSTAPVAFFAKSLVGRFRSCLHSLKSTATAADVFLQDTLKLVETLPDLSEVNIHAQKCYEALQNGEPFNLEPPTHWSPCTTKCVREWVSSYLEQPREQINDDSFHRVVSSLKIRYCELLVLLCFELLHLATSFFPELPSITDKTSLIYQLFYKLKVCLESAFDRLCIWRSLEEKPPGAIEEDFLIKFCQEVIHPFYGSKFPHISVKLLQKCSGPGFNTSRSSHSSTNSSSSKSRKRRVSDIHGLSSKVPSIQHSAANRQQRLKSRRYTLDPDQIKQLQRKTVSPSPEAIREKRLQELNRSLSLPRFLTERSKKRLSTSGVSQFRSREVEMPSRKMSSSEHMSVKVSNLSTSRPNRSLTEAFRLASPQLQLSRTKSTSRNSIGTLVRSKTLSDLDDPPSTVQVQVQCTPQKPARSTVEFNANKPIPPPNLNLGMTPPKPKQHSLHRTQSTYPVSSIFESPSKRIPPPSFAVPGTPVKQTVPSTPQKPAP